MIIQFLVHCFSHWQRFVNHEMISLNQLRRVHLQMVKRKQKNLVGVAKEREGGGEVAQPQLHPEEPEAVEGEEGEVQREEKMIFQVITCTLLVFFYVL